jgi:Arc/MetJ-type ribon-helix-helix transcriptional regulator
VAFGKVRAYSERVSVRIQVSVPEEDARLLDEAVARGRFASRSDALRAGLAFVLREEREPEIDEADRSAQEESPPEDRVGREGLIFFQQLVESEGDSEPF